jgi:hypothetical protein
VGEVIRAGRCAIRGALLVTALTLPLVSGEASAATEALPKLGAAPGFVAAGATVTVSGSGFPANADVEIGFVPASCRCDDEPSAVVSTDGRGALRWRHRLPVSTKPGRYLFWAWSQRVGATVETSVIVTRPRPVGSARIFVPNCGSTWYLEYQPSLWSQGCTGGSLNVTRLSWRSYAAGGARALGQAALRKPCGAAPCSQAGIYTTSARVLASRPLRCPGGTLRGSRYFSQIQVDVLYRDDNPFGIAAGWQRTTFVIKAANGVCHHSP